MTREFAIWEVGESAKLRWEVDPDVDGVMVAHGQETCRCVMGGCFLAVLLISGDGLR